MIDRRLLAGGLVVVLVVLGARHTMTTADAPAAVNEIAATTPAVRVDIPLSIGPPTQAATSSTVREPAVASSSVVTTSQPSTSLGSSSTVVELVDLVDAARPTLPPVEVVDDGHDHTANVVDVATIASHVVVTVWTWRFDAHVGRVETGLDGHATADVIAMLTPDQSERARRADASEVAWVIVRTVDVDADDDGAVVTVTFDHHLVTSTSPETVTARQVAVTVVDDQVVDVAEVSD